MKRIVLAAWIAAACLLGNPARAQSADALKIGVVCPLSGPSAVMGVSVRNSLRLIAKEINQTGGILGQPIRLVERDDQGSPDVGRQVAQDLIEKEKVVATIGYCNSGVAIAAIDAFQKAHVPLIIPVATGTLLTQKFQPPLEPANYIFRAAMPDRYQVTSVIEYMIAHGQTKIAILADSTGYGEGGVNDATSALAAHGLKPVAVERFALGVKDLSDAVARARAAGATALFTCTLGPENAVISLNLDRSGWHPVRTGPWTVGFSNHLSVAGKAADGAVLPQTFIQEAAHNPVRSEFLYAYAREYGGGPIECAMCAAQAYDAMRILMAAIGQAIATQTAITGPTIQAQLEDIRRPIRGVITTYDRPYSKADHEALSSNMIVLGIVRDGHVKFLSADDERRSFLLRKKAQ